MGFRGFHRSSLQRLKSTVAANDLIAIACWVLLKSACKEDTVGIFNFWGLLGLKLYLFKLVYFHLEVRLIGVLVY